MLMLANGVPHTTQCVLHLDFANGLVGMAFHLFEEFSFCWDDFFERGF